MVFGVLMPKKKTSYRPAKPAAKKRRQLLECHGMFPTNIGGTIFKWHEIIWKTSSKSEIMKIVSIVQVQ